MREIIHTVVRRIEIDHDSIEVVFRVPPTGGPSGGGPEPPRRGTWQHCTDGQARLAYSDLSAQTGASPGCVGEFGGRSGPGGGAGRDHHTSRRKRHPHPIADRCAPGGAHDFARRSSIMRADSRAVAIPPGSHRLIAGGAKCPVSCLSCRMIICSLRNCEHFFEILLSASLLARRLLIQEFFQTQGLSGIV